MIVVQTEMANVDLNLLLSRLALPKLLANLEEAFFDLALYTRLQLLLHIVELKILSFEVLERVALLLCITWLHVSHDRLLCVSWPLHLIGHITEHTCIVLYFWNWLRPARWLGSFVWLARVLASLTKERLLYRLVLLVRKHCCILSDRLC